MTTTLTLAPSEVVPTDLLVGIDHIDLPPMTVDRAPVVNESGTTVIHLEAPKGSMIEWQRYLEPDQRVRVQRRSEETLLVSPAKPKPSRPTTYTRKGVRLKRDEHGDWWTLDGRFQFNRDEGWSSECESPHPMPLTDADVSTPAYDRTWWPSEKTEALMTNRSGYLCPGGYPHTYPLWVMWDTQAAGGSGDVIDRASTMTELFVHLPAEYGYHH